MGSSRRLLLSSSEYREVHALLKRRVSVCTLAKQEMTSSKFLVNSSNLLKATMAPIRWHSGEKPLSMKSSVLCLSRSGLETLMGTAIRLGWEEGSMNWNSTTQVPSGSSRCCRLFSS